MNFEINNKKVDWKTLPIPVLNKWLSKVIKATFPGKQLATEEEYHECRDNLPPISDVAYVARYLQSLTHKIPPITPNKADRLLSVGDEFSLTMSDGQTKIVIKKGEEKGIVIPVVRGCVDTSMVASGLVETADYNEMAAQLASDFIPVAGVVNGEWDFANVMDEKYRKHPNHFSVNEAIGAQEIVKALTTKIDFGKTGSFWGPDLAEKVYHHIARLPVQTLAYATGKMTYHDPQNTALHTKYQSVKFMFNNTETVVKLRTTRMAPDVSIGDTKPQIVHENIQLYTSLSGGTTKYNAQYQMQALDGVPLSSGTRRYLNLAVDLNQLNLDAFDRIALNTKDANIAEFVYYQLNKPNKILKLYILGNIGTTQEKMKECEMSGGIIKCRDFGNLDSKKVAFVDFFDAPIDVIANHFVKVSENAKSEFNNRVSSIRFENFVVRNYFLGLSKGTLCSDSFRGNLLYGTLLKGMAGVDELLIDINTFAKFALRYKYFRVSYNSFVTLYNTQPIESANKVKKINLRNIPYPIVKVVKGAVRGVESESLGGCLVSNAILVAGEQKYDELIAQLKDVSLADNPGNLKENVKIDDSPVDLTSFMAKMGSPQTTEASEKEKF